MRRMPRRFRSGTASALFTMCARRYSAARSHRGILHSLYRLCGVPAGRGGSIFKEYPAVAGNGRGHQPHCLSCRDDISCERKAVLRKKREGFCSRVVPSALLYRLGAVFRVRAGYRPAWKTVSFRSDPACGVPRALLSACRDLGGQYPRCGDNGDFRRRSYNRFRHVVSLKCNACF